MSGCNPCDPIDERAAAGVIQTAFALSPPERLSGITCQEASQLSITTYIACGRAATCVVWHAKDKRAYPMCTACGWHNVRNRGGHLLMATEDVPDATREPRPRAGGVLPAPFPIDADEQKALSESPEAIQALIDYHDAQEDQAESQGWTEWAAESAARRQQFEALRDGAQKKCDSEGTGS